MSSLSSPPQKSETLSNHTFKQALSEARAQHQPPSFARRLVIALSIGALALTPLLLIWLPLWSCPLLCLSGTLGMLWSTILIHECAHESFFTQKPVNHITGTIMGLWLLLPFGAYQRGHRAHHKWSGHPSKDPTPSPQQRRHDNRLLDLMLQLRVIPILYWGGVYGPYLLYALKPTAHQRKTPHVVRWFAQIFTSIGLLIALGLYHPVALLCYGICFWCSGLLYDYLFTMHHHIGLGAKPPANGKRHTYREQLHHTRSTTTKFGHMLLHFNLHKEHHLVPGEHYSLLPHLHHTLTTHAPSLYRHTTSKWRFAKRTESFAQLTAPNQGDS